MFTNHLFSGSLLQFGVIFELVLRPNLKEKGGKKTTFKISTGAKVIPGDDNVNFSALSVPADHYARDGRLYRDLSWTELWSGYLDHPTSAKCRISFLPDPDEPAVVGSVLKHVDGCLWIHVS